MKKTKEELNREVYEYMYHPMKIAKYLEENEDVEDYLA
jgi:hypothetical protein